ncbi:hypothetical protein, partial [Neisseria meningitidis]
MQPGSKNDEKNKITLNEFNNAIVTIFSDENVVRAIGTINTMHGEYLTRSHKIDQQKFLSDGERLSSKAKDFQHSAEKTQRALKEGIGRAASKFHANSKEAFVARKMQSDLQKKLNA